MNEHAINRRPLLIELWFLLDAVLVLAPPLHWWMARRVEPVTELPATLLYFLAVSAFVALSVVVAYLLEGRDDGDRP